MDHGVASPVVLSATSERVLDHVSPEDLCFIRAQKNSLDVGLRKILAFE